MNETSAVPWLISEITVDTVARMVGTLITVLVTLWGFSSTRFSRVRRATRKLSGTKLEDTDAVPKHLLPRDGLMKSLQKALKEETFHTILVYGERGAGKTTAVQNALCGRRGVKRWTLIAREGEAVSTELRECWKSMFASWEKPMDNDFDKDVCKSFKYGEELVVVIEVEASTEPSGLESVLYFCKMMSYNRHLARFVVDISSSRAAVAVHADLRKLRVRGVEVGTVEKQEAESLLDHVLPQAWEKSKIKTVSATIVEALDFLLLTLVDVCSVMEEGMPTEKAIEKVTEFYEEQMTSATEKLKAFDVAMEKEFKNSSVPELIKDGKLDHIGMDKLTNKIPPRALMAIVSQLGAPYIFSLDPFSRKISLNGKVMTDAFVKRYKK